MSVSYPLSHQTPTLPPPWFPDANAVGSPPPPLSPDELLTEVLDLCSIDWVRSFLFTPDPIHVHAFNSPDFTSSALTGTLTVARYLCDPGISQIHPEPFQHLVDNLVIVQDFSAAGVIVGHGVKESSVESGAAWLPTPATHSPTMLSSTDAVTGSTSSSHSESIRATIHFNVRFAIAPERQTALFVYDAPSHDAVVIRCSRYQSASLVHMFKLVLQRMPFLSLMRSSVTLHAPDIVPFARSLQHELQARACQSCALSRTTAARGCRCHLAAPSPRHPRDVANFATVMASQVGDYAGIARVGFHRLVSHVQVRGVVDPCTTLRLRDWALHGYATRITSPRKRVLLPPYDQAPAEVPQLDAVTSDESIANFNADHALTLNMGMDERVDGNSKHDVLNVEGDVERAQRRAALERRREKNRISASLCNQRKRKQRLWLEGEVRRGNEKVKELKNRENALLQENRRLYQEINRRP